MRNASGNAPGPFTHSVQVDGRDELLEARAWVMPGTTRSASARVFVLIHGVGLSHRPYGRLARALARNGTVVCFDLPGFGGLRRPSRRVSVSEYAEVVTRLLTVLGIGRYEVIGHSMGAQIALEVALIDPGRVDAAILIGPVVEPERQGMFLQTVDLGRDSALEPPTTILMIFRDYFTCGPLWYLTEVRAMLAYRTDLRIQQLTVPLLVLRGANDPIASARWCHWLARQATRGKSISLIGHRHVVVHTAPDEIGALISSFGRRVHS
jgi:pimeloyl-ACP methyl ester carboxylesterase